MGELTLGLQALFWGDRLFFQKHYLWCVENRSDPRYSVTLIH